MGCYTTAARKARGDGIHVYQVDTGTGAWTLAQRAGDLVNPSFLILSRDQRFLYSAHGDEGYATSFSLDAASGHLEILGKADTGGKNGVHLALSPGGRFMVLANYGTGTLAVLPVRPDGRLADQTQLVKLEGQPGPNRVEQAASHPHQVVFDPSGQFVLAPDKGLDRVFVFRFDETAGRLTATSQGSVATRSGAGPRHLAFHPKLPVVWVLNELGSSVATYSWDVGTGTLHPQRILPTLPPDFTGDSIAAEIAVSADGRFVYCSNRGHDSVAVFRADAKTGRLEAVGWTPTQGESPRFICIDPRQGLLYAANEQGDSIVGFRIDRATGKLTPTGLRVPAASPATIAIAGGA